MKLICERLPEPDGEEPPKEAVLKLAIVGRRNTGKSTFINCLAQSERMIVSEVPGTTRDSVDVRFERDGQAFIAIDTAGVRRRAASAPTSSFTAWPGPNAPIRRADVVLLFFDPRVRISKVDKQLAGVHPGAAQAGHLRDQQVGPDGAACRPARSAITSAHTFPESRFRADRVHHGQGRQERAGGAEPGPEPAQAGQRSASAPAISTACCGRHSRRNRRRMRQNRRPKVYYATQVATNPPTIVLFTNGPELFDNTYSTLPAQDVPRPAAVFRTCRSSCTSGDRKPRGRATPAVTIAEKASAPKTSKRQKKRLPKPEKDVSG